MHRNTKLATCCYCGKRAALVLSEDHHTLVCGGCGAPLSNLKSLPSGKVGNTAAVSAPFEEKTVKKKKSKKRPKPKKSSFRRVFGDILDEIEDIFD